MAETSPHRRSSSRTLPPAPGDPRSRFLEADRYRVEREWNRYSGTAQRDLFRILRVRFIERHRVGARWAIDIGSGPGRFTPTLTSPGGRTIALDLSVHALQYLSERWPSGDLAVPPPDRVRGDALRPPCRSGAFGVVALLGNGLGFAGSAADAMLTAVSSLVAPGGRLLLEIAPGPGESSRYLHRLPSTSLGRLLRAPVAAVLPRIEREGFQREAARRDRPGSFRRLSVDELEPALRRSGFALREALAVAPGLGAHPKRVREIRSDPKAWDHLLAIEEELGRRPERLQEAAAVLVAAERLASEDTIN